MARSPILHETESVPEADRLEDFPHPRLTAQLYGHDDAEAGLAAAVASGRMHHGWLITGREGVGKATLAYRLAKHVLAAPGERDPFARSLGIDPDSLAARQVRALSHPGLLVIRRPYDLKSKRLMTTITVDEVRRLRSFLGHSAADGGWRVVIVDSADELNASAANALLKSLEEPPAQTVFLLVCAEPGRLLATIRSRTRTIALADLAMPDVIKAAGAALAAAGREAPPADESSAMAALAHGSVRRFLILAGSDGLALDRRIVGILGQLPRLDWPQAHSLADEITAAAAERRFEQFFDLLLDRLASLVRVRAGGHAGRGAMISGGLADAPLASLAELWETIVREKAEAKALNLDRKTLVLGTLARLEAIARR